MGNWKYRFEDMGAFWKHDGNPKRPYALLTSGKISDFFFNGSRVIERPEVLAEVAARLIVQYEEQPDAKVPQIVIGPALGAIPLIYEMARQLQGTPRAWFSEEDPKTKKIVFKRFDNARNLRRALLVEDVITTGKSSMKTVTALRHLDPSIELLPSALCIINRSGKTTLPDRTPIIALLTINATAWDRGNNPFTPNGEELVEPVRPKANWEALVRAY